MPFLSSSLDPKCGLMLALVTWTVGWYPTDTARAQILDWRAAIEKIEPAIVSIQFHSDEKTKDEALTLGLRVLGDRVTNASPTASEQVQLEQAIAAHQLQLPGNDLAIKWVRGLNAANGREVHILTDVTHHERCSGLVLTPSGLIVTIADQRPTGNVTITLVDGKSSAAKVVAYDEVTGCVIIQSDRTDLNPVEWSTTSLSLGMPVACAWTRGNRRSMVVGQGIVASYESPLGTREVPSIETDITVRAGAVGGALVNAHGECVGIVNAMSSRTGDVGPAYAILWPTLKPLVDRIKSDATLTLRRGMIGVTFDDAANRIGKITLNSPAALAGVIPGDQITQVGGKTVLDSEEARAALRQYRAGDTVDIVFERDGNRMDRAVRLSSPDEIATLQTSSTTADNSNAIASETEKLRLAVELLNSHKQPSILNESFARTWADKLANPSVAPVLQVERTDFERSIQSLMNEISLLRKEVQAIRDAKK